MQKTKFDRWLRSKYAYITRVYTNTMPAKVSSGIKVDNLDVESGAPYRYRFSSVKAASIRSLARQLDLENITYTSRVEDRDVWYGRFINNPRKSISYQFFWICCLIGVVMFAFSPAPLTIWSLVNDGDGTAKPAASKSRGGISPKEKLAEWSGRFKSALK